MSEASKPGCDPTVAAAAGGGGDGPSPGGPPELPASASTSQAAGPDSPPLGPGDAPAASPPPPPAAEDEEDPKALLQAAAAAAAEEGRAPQAPSAAQPVPAAAPAAQPVPAPAAAPPTAAQLVQKAHELMWYVLVKDQRRMVLWFPDMVRDVLGSYKKWCRGILRRTSLLLARVFGLHLRLTSLHTLEFSLVRALEPAELERAALGGGRMPMMGLLLLVLSLIYVKGRGARESAVWNVLRILGLRPWKKHPTFGDVRRVLTEEFVQQSYLKYQRVPHAEPPEFEFFWGPRATREISKLQIMEYLARVFKKDPQAWPSRYREALEEARARRAAAPPTPCPRNSFSED